jgi:hypothetical protein
MQKTTNHMAHLVKMIVEKHKKAKILSIQLGVQA